MENNKLSRKLGILITRLRREQGFTQEAFAEVCDLHRAYQGVVERGEKNINIETAQKIGKALGLTLGQLFTLLDAEPEPPEPLPKQPYRRKKKKRTSASKKAGAKKKKKKSKAASPAARKTASSKKESEPENPPDETPA